MKKVVILVNKEFEYKGFKEGIESVLSNAELARRVNLREDNIDLQKTIKKDPLETYVFENLEADVYCIQYLFPKGENSSNSEQKYNHLTNIFSSFETKPDYVMSVSTSESTPDSEAWFGNEETVNGCVFIGNQFFLSDQGKCDPTTKSNLKIEKSFYKDPLLHDRLYNTINNLSPEFLAFKKPHNSPASVLKCHAGANFVGIDVVNVMNYECYEMADAAAYEEFRESFPEAMQDKHMPIGIETTHGVVKMAVAKALPEKTPVMFISPITDRFGHFKDDVQGDQNHICSYNGGVATGHILTILNELLGRTDK